MERATDGAKLLRALASPNPALIVDIADCRGPNPPPLMTDIVEFLQVVKRLVRQHQLLGRLEFWVSRLEGSRPGVYACSAAAPAAGEAGHATMRCLPRPKTCDAGLQILLLRFESTSHIKYGSKSFARMMTELQAPSIAMDTLLYSLPLSQRCILDFAKWPACGRCSGRVCHFNLL